MVNFKVGEMMTLYANVELKDFLGNKTLAKKGTKIWIGADNLAHYHDGSIQRLAEDSTVRGYDGEGIAERIYMQLASRFPLNELEEDYEISSKDIKDEIVYALEELGIC